MKILRRNLLPALLMFTILLTGFSVLKLGVKGQTSDIQYGFTNGIYWFQNAYYRFDLNTTENHCLLNITRLDVNRVVFAGTMFDVYSNITGIAQWAQTISTDSFDTLTENVSDISTALGTGKMFTLTFAESNSPPYDPSPISIYISVYGEQPFFTIQMSAFNWNTGPAYIKAWSYFYLNGTTGSVSGLLVGDNKNYMYEFPNDLSALSSNSYSPFTLISNNNISTYTFGEIEDPQFFSILSSTENEGVAFGMLSNNYTSLYYCSQDSQQNEKYGIATFEVDGETTPFTDSGVNSNQYVPPNSWAYSDLLYVEFTGNDANTIFNGYKNALTQINNYPAQKMLGREELGWTSWQPFATGITEASMLTEASYISTNLQNIKVFQIDDGWEIAAGTWQPNTNFPDGIGYLASQLHAEGLFFGLWIAPFVISEDSENYNPAWLLTNSSGDVRIQFDGNNAYLLDPSNPNVQTFVRQVFENFSSWGVDYVKVDLSWNPFSVIAQDNCDLDSPATPTQLLNLFLTSLHDALPNVHLELGGVPWFNSGPIDSQSRVGTDIYVKYSTFLELATKTSVWDTVMGKDTILLDLDSITDQNIGEKYPMSDTMLKTWLTLQYVSGGVQMYGVDFLTYNQTRLSWMQKFNYVASTGLTPTIADFKPSASYPPDAWLINAVPFIENTTDYTPQGLVALFNWQNTTQEISVNLADLGLNSSQPYIFFDIWSNDTQEVVNSYSVELQGKESAAYIVKEETANPSVIYVNGTLNLLMATQNQIIFTSSNPGSAYIYAGTNGSPSSVYVNGIPAGFSYDPNLKIITTESVSAGATVEVDWALANTSANQANVSANRLSEHASPTTTLAIDPVAEVGGVAVIGCVGASLYYRRRKKGKNQNRFGVILA